MKITRVESSKRLVIGQTGLYAYFERLNLCGASSVVECGLPMCWLYSGACYRPILLWGAFSREVLIASTIPHLAQWAKNSVAQ
jgi:hypothetical protein